jgi:hypothetical protein
MDKGAGKPDPDSLAEVKALWPEVTAKVARLPYLREFTPGSQMDSTDPITIAGTSVFQGGFLGGDTGTLVVKGTISPHPEEPAQGLGRRRSRILRVNGR